MTIDISSEAVMQAVENVSDHVPPIASDMIFALLNDRDRLAALQAETARELAEAREALVWFLEDTRFHVAVGGNPIVVERMLDRARAVLAKHNPPGKEKESTS